MKVIETEHSKNSSGHYVAGMVYNNTLYVSGQLSMDPETNIIPEGGIHEETKQALKNLDSVLEAAGVTRNEVIQCKIYIPDVKYWGAVNEEYAKFFGDHKPSRVIVPSNNLFNDCLIEIEAIAKTTKGE